MSSSKHAIELFSTLGCHLCEDAEALIQDLQAQGWAIELLINDIAENEQLVEQYGIRIPVVKRQDGEELGWPFTLEDLASFLQTDAH